MKRWIHSATSYRNEIESIAKEAFASSNPGTGCTFIAPDGTFVNIYPKLAVHEDLCEWVESELGVELEYNDEEYFIREFGWIRLRSDPHMCIIELPNGNPTNNQWYSLEDWLYFVEEKYPNSVTIYLNVCDGNDADVEYKLGRDGFAEDLLKLLKRYYSSGKLYASTSYSKSAILAGTWDTKVVDNDYNMDELDLYLDGKRGTFLQFVENLLSDKDQYDDHHRMLGVMFVDASLNGWDESLTGCPLDHDRYHPIFQEALNTDLSKFVPKARKVINRSLEDGVESWNPECRGDRINLYYKYKRRLKDK